MNSEQVRVLNYDDDFLEESLLDELGVDGGHPVHSVAPWQIHVKHLTSPAKSTLGICGVDC